MNISSSLQDIGLHQEETGDLPFLHLSLGCDGVVVVGLDTQDSKSGSVETELVTDGTDEGWFDDLVIRARQPDRATESNRRKESAIGSDCVARKRPNGVAIHLQSTDALLFTGPSRKAWWGMAKVFEGTCPVWEDTWPYWQSNLNPFPAQQGWRGVMRNRRLDLIFQ